MSDIFNDLMNFRANRKDVGRVEPENKMKPSERFLADLRLSGFDLSQMGAVLTTKGNQLIVSCAGSGKTTALVFKIMYDLKTGYATKVKEINGNVIRVPEDIWVSTFLHTGALELEASLRNWQRKMNCVDTSSVMQFSTLHAEFKRALAAMGINTDIVSSKDNSLYLKEVVKSYQLKNANGVNLTSEDYKNLESALGYTRNRLDAQRYIHNTYEDLNIGKTIIDAILRDWKEMRRKNGVVDFEDLQELLYIECYEKSNQEVINFLSNRYKFIYIDEFQDTSQIQYALLKLYSANAKQIVAIGDDDQSIYSWRGGDSDIIINKFREDFHPVVNQLSINFRCPSNILNAISPSIKNNSVRYEKDLTSSREGGVVRLAKATNYPRMVSVLSDMVYDDVKNGLDVAILCRVNSDGLMPALILDKLGKFTFSISGDGMTLDSYIGRTVLSIVKLFTEKSTPAVKSALSLLAWDSWGINNLIKVCKTNKLSIWTIDEADLSYSCPSIAQKILLWRSWKNSMGEVQALRLVLQDYRVSVFQKDSQFNNVMRSVLSSVEALLDFFDYSYVEDFQYELEDINERLKARKKQGGVKVRIATVHEFKGKEADSVYIWNDTQDVFPFKDSKETLSDYEEERRVHYIACTRAKKISTILTLKGKEGEFLNEMDLSNAEIIEEGNYTEDTEGSHNTVFNKIKGNLTEESNLKMFENIASEPTENSGSGIELYKPVYNENTMFAENEFWGVE